jgi:hypothetical protein
MHRAFQDAVWNAEQFLTRTPVSTGAVAPAPVAWRFKMEDGGWCIVNQRPDRPAPRGLPTSTEWQALYTHPAPADTGQGGRVEELEAALRAGCRCRSWMAWTDKLQLSSYLKLAIVANEWQCGSAAGH